MSLHPGRILSGLLLSTGIGILAYRRYSLSRSGIAGATITGTATFGFGGWSWGLSLIFFFLSSSILSHFREHDKAQTAADKFSKGGQRDIAQAMANGGMATLLSLCYGLTSSAKVRTLLEAGYIGALATATADTWATELGVLSTQPPRLITTGKRTTPGTSGGITPLGTSAAAAGALALGLFFSLLKQVERHLGTQLRNKFAHPSVGATFMTPISPTDSDAPRESHLKMGLPHPNRGVINVAPTDNRTYTTLIIALVSGLAGALFDSLLGATVQAMYYCPTCHKETERQIHSCGTQTRPLRGISWIDNDVVNFLATLVGSVVAMVLRVFW